MPNSNPTPDSSRPCGPCTVCCSALGIEELKKYAGPQCVHLTRGTFGDQHRCGIYKDRPIACSRFYCAWTFGLGPQANGRPDRSGLMVVLYSPYEDQPISAVISIVDDRRCGELSDPESLIQQFIRQLLESGITNLKVLNRATSGVLYISDGVIRRGQLRPQTTYEDLQFEVFDPPVGLALTVPISPGET